MLPNKVEKFITNYDLLSKGEKVIVAVSGGMDSVALLHVLLRLRERLSLELGVLHVHHGLRGREADEDLAFTRDLAREWGCPFWFRKVLVKEHAEQHKLSLEAAARELRYQAFALTLAETGFDKVATGHTADDQAETLLDHFLRGSGLLGLRGIPPKRGCYIRPLLGVERAELQAYVQRHRLAYRTDSTNADLRFRRNRIRHGLLPYLKSHLNPNLVSTLGRTARIFDETGLFLEAEAEKAFKSLVSLREKNQIILDIDGFLKYFILIRKYVLFRACDALSIPRQRLNYATLELMLSVIERRRLGSRVCIGKSHELCVDRDGIVVRRIETANPITTFDVVQSTSLFFRNFEFKWTLLDTDTKIEFTDARSVEYFDFAKTGRALSLRLWAPGDKFVPLNFQGTKKVADLFSDRKIPHHLRRTTPILLSSDKIVWVCGYRIDDRFKVTKTTKEVLRIEFSHVDRDNRTDGKVS